MTLFKFTKDDEYNFINSLYNSKKQSPINSVYLQNLYLSDETLNYFIDLLNETPYITRIYLDNISIDIVIFIITHSRFIKEILISNSKISLDAAHALEQSIMKNQYLNKISLSSNNFLKYESVNLALRSFLQNNVIQELFLDNVKLSLQSSKILGWILGRNRSLTTLSLGNCNLTNNLNSITKGLSKNITLKYINLQDNNIVQTQVVKFCKMLVDNKTLTSVNLKSNNIGKSKSI